MTCTLPSVLLSDYLSDRAQCFVNVLALTKHKPESCQIGPETTKYVQAVRSVSDHIMRDSKVVASAFAVPSSSPQSNPAVEKMNLFLESVNSIEAIQPWTVVLRMRDFLGATISSLLTQPVAELNAFATAHVQAWKTVVEAEQLKELPRTMSPVEIAQLRRIFTTVLQYELALLESALAENGQAFPELTQLKKSPWHASNIIFTTDYDVTCTFFDSCYFMLQDDEAFIPVMARYEELQREIYLSLESQEEEGEHPTYWRERERNENEFLSGLDPLLQPVYKFLSEEITESKEEMTSPYNDAGLRRALIKLANLEEICNWDIMSVGFLKGFTREEIREKANKVLLRPNCTEVLQQLAQVGASVHIVSANWSRDVILGGLPHLAKDGLFVHCNELHFDSAARVSQGTFDNTCVDAFDKEKILRLLRRLPSSTTVSTDESAESVATQQGSSNEQAGKMLVFMGDSPTDLLGLLEADLGIVFGESPRLRRLLSLYNIQLLPLAAATAHISVARSCGSNWTCRRSGILFEAQGWPEVDACLFGQVEVAEFISALPLSSKIEKLIEDAQNQIPLEHKDRAIDLLTPISLDMIRVSS